MVSFPSSLVIENKLMTNNDIKLFTMSIVLARGLILYVCRHSHHAVGTKAYRNNVFCIVWEGVMAYQTIDASHGTTNNLQTTSNGTRPGDAVHSTIGIRHRRYLKNKFSAVSDRWDPAIFRL